MIDMDGTVYKGDRVIPGAPGFIERLNEKNIPFVFLTNNSAYDRRHYHDKLVRMGFKVKIDNILTSATATVSYLLKYRKGKSVYPLGTPRFVKEAEDSGIKMTDRDPDIVLLSFDKTITYEKMNNAYQFIKKGAELVATHPDDLCPTEDGYDIDIGPFIRLLESMTGVKATIIGKPNKIMAEMAAERMDTDMKGLVMIGDRIYTDIKMASDAGIRSIMVLSGEAKREDVTPDIMPTMIADSLDDILR